MFAFDADAEAAIFAIVAVAVVAAGATDLVMFVFGLFVCACDCVYVGSFVYVDPALAINLLGLYVIIEELWVADGICIFGFFSTTISFLLLPFVCFI